MTTLSLISEICQMRAIILTFLATVLCLPIVCAAEAKAGDAPRVGASEPAEGKLRWERIGWNTQVKQRFMHPPVFHFPELDNATSYRCTIGWQEGNLSQSCVVESKTSDIDLTDTWVTLPPAGKFQVSAEVIDTRGKSIGQFSFGFERIAPFTGPYLPAKADYLESGAKAALWVLQKPTTRGLAEAFPALFASAYIRVLTTYARLHPKSESTTIAIETAKKHGEFLMKGSTPADWVYANMPMSHNERRLQIGRSGMVGMAYLDLLRATGDKRFLDGAVRIAETLKITQLEDGRWYFRVEPKTGKMLEDYTSDQVEAIILMDELIRKHGKKDLIETREKAVKWMLENPCKTFNWQQQWDDVGENPPYKNLEWYDTALFIEYLLCHATPQNDYEKVALDLLRYIEDQFVEWEPTGDYITPCVREQYFCYHGIDWHGAHYIRICIDFHARTKDDVYLKKAKAMANMLTVVQHTDGFYPTWMRYKPSQENPRDLREIDYEKVWANCTSYTGEILMKLGEYLQGVPPAGGTH